MGAGWTTGGVRARAMLARRLGHAGTRRIAACDSLAAAVAVLRQSPYGRGIRDTEDLEGVQHAVAATLLWHLRVLAGWQPRRGADALRVLAAWFEITNIVEHARALVGGVPAEPFRTGALATAWPMLAATGSPQVLRTALARSPWRDPGTTTPAGIALALQTAWAERVLGVVLPAAAWAAAGAAIVVGRERFLTDRGLSARVAHRAEALLGSRAARAPSWESFVAALPVRAGWAFVDTPGPDDLWRAENTWWRRVERDGFGLLRGPRFGLPGLVGCVAVLAADARRAQAALEVAARGGRELEAFDALG
jgi:hypothetical protein